MANKTPARTLMEKFARNMAKPASRSLISSSAGLNEEKLRGVASIQSRDLFPSRHEPSSRFFRKEITVFFERRKSHKLVRKTVTAHRSFEYPRGTNFAGS